LGYRDSSIKIILVISIIPLLLYAEESFGGAEPFQIFDGDLLEDPFGNTGNTTLGGQFDFAPDPAYVPIAPILEPINGTIFISRDDGSFRVFEDPIKDGLTVDIGRNSAGEIFIHIPGVGPDGRDEISVDLTSGGMTNAIQVSTNVGQVSGVLPFIDIADGSGGSDSGVPAAIIENERIVFPLMDFTGTDLTDVGVVDLHFEISDQSAARSFTVTDIFGTSLAPPPPGSPTIKITVDTIDGDGSFDFTIFNATNPANQTAVNIPDTFINNMSAPLTVQVGIFGGFSVIETVPLNWSLISSDCLINGIPHGSTLNFNIVNGDTVECIFENLFVPPPSPPTIKITKDTTNGDGSFNFTIFNATNPANSTALNIPDTSINNMTAPLTVQASSFSVIETVPLNWTLISSDCLINGIPHGSTLNFNIVNGDTVECIFENLFVPPPEPTKVEVCHKNKKTLSINPDSVDDHINDHGDILGPCENGDKQKKVKEPKEEKQKKPKKSKK